MLCFLITATKFGGRLLAFCLVHLLGFILAAQLSGVTSQADIGVARELAASDRQAEHVADRQAATADKLAGSANSQQLGLLGMVVLVCLLNSAVLMTWMVRSSLYGLWLSGAVFVVFFMCLTVMPQSETYFFLSQSKGIIRHAVTMGLVVCGLFSIAAVPILHRWREPPAERAARRLPNITTPGMLWRLAVCAVVYAVLYLVFGYFVAWQNPDVRSLYGGVETGGFWKHITSSPVATRVIPFQLARGIFWTLLCLAMIRYSKSGLAGRAIIIGLVLAVVMNAQLLIPNPIMSHSVRMTHLIETATSNFLFGVFCVLFWARSQGGFNVDAY